VNCTPILIVSSGFLVILPWHKTTILGILAIPKFDGHYDHWAMLMENLLRSKEYWVIVEQGVPVQPATPTAEQRKLVEEGKLKDLKAKNYLFQSIDRSIIETIFDKSLSRAIWESMLKSFKDLQR
jgi:hypothetical protein